MLGRLVSVWHLAFLQIGIEWGCRYFFSVSAATVEKHATATLHSTVLDACKATMRRFYTYPHLEFFCSIDLLSHR